MRDLVETEVTRIRKYIQHVDREIKKFKNLKKLKN